MNLRRATVGVAALAVAAGVLASAPPAGAAASPTAVTTPTTTTGSGRVALGDSVMLGAESALRGRGFSVNARTSRQFSAAVPYVRDRVRTLPRNLVVHLGTNGYISASDCRRVVTLAGPGRRVFLVTTKAPREWQSANNRRIRACDAAFAPDRVVVVDWYAAARANPGWLYADGIHLTRAGRTGYARLIDAAVDRFGL